MTSPPHGTMARRPSSFRVYLQLGRVSNLPTVWSNVVAGTALGLGRWHWSSTLLCLLAVSSVYVGGMFLNDAFDRHVDAVERPERPIPRGWISPRRVFAVGYLLAVLGVALAALAPVPSGYDASAPALISAVALVLAVVLYNARHKRNPFAPWIMGTCRALVYVTAALAQGGFLTPCLLIGAAALLPYVVGLTWVARAESPGSKPVKWPRALLLAPVLGALALVGIGSAPLVPSLVGIALLLVWIGWSLAPLRHPKPKVPLSVIRMIAGISWVDGLFASSALGLSALALGPIAAFATLGLQRVARGT